MGRNLRIASINFFSCCKIISEKFRSVYHTANGIKAHQKGIIYFSPKSRKKFAQVFAKYPNCICTGITWRQSNYKANDTFPSLDLSLIRFNMYFGQQSIKVFKWILLKLRELQEFDINQAEDLYNRKNIHFDMIFLYSKYISNVPKLHQIECLGIMYKI